MNQSSNRKKNVIATVVMGLGTVALASGCAAGSATPEDIASTSQALTADTGWQCATPYQIGADIIRASMMELGRYRPGLDLIKSDADQTVSLTSTGLAQCAARTGCKELKSLLRTQFMTNDQFTALSSEFPYMAAMPYKQTAVSNAIDPGMPSVNYPNPNAIMTHNLTFAYTRPASTPSQCNANLTYDCFSVTGLPAGKTVTDLSNQLIQLFSGVNQIEVLLRPMVDSNNNLCIDPDGTGSGSTGTGSTGGSTCVDGTMAISYDPTYVGTCCATAAGSGFLVTNAIDSSYMSCKLTDLAAGKVATADSQLATNPASNTTDADLNTMWKAADTAANHNVKVDLGTSQNIKGVTFKFEAPGAYGYKVETSATGVLWATKLTGTSVATATAQDAGFPQTAARYVRVTLTSMPAGKSGALSSVRVYN